jgi:hypothetical protein
MACWRLHCQTTLPSCGREGTSRVYTTLAQDAKTEIPG